MTPNAKFVHSAVAAQLIDTLEQVDPRDIRDFLIARLSERETVEDEQAENEALASDLLALIDSRIAFLPPARQEAIHCAIEQRRLDRAEDRLRQRHSA